MKANARFVLDASTTMAWCFEDEADDYADAVLHTLLNAPAIAPSLWVLEVANVLPMGDPSLFRITSRLAASRTSWWRGAIPRFLPVTRPSYYWRKSLLYRSQLGTRRYAKPPAGWGFTFSHRGPSHSLCPLPLFAGLDPLPRCRYIPGRRFRQSSSPGC